MSPSEAALTGNPFAKARLIFWDFDGVIKDSIAVKTRAFVRLFLPHGMDVAEQVCAHHQANGGMSRFEKIPLYLGWAEVAATSETVDEYCRRFANLACQGVIDAPWVPGAEEFLRGNPYGQEFVLVTATPQGEIEKILAALNLRNCFTEVYGAPTSKRDAIRSVLDTRRYDSQQCLMIGDARADYDAALANQTPFLLRRHDSNGPVFERYAGNSIADFTGFLLSGRKS